MPYPRRLLNEGEEIALDLRPHWWFFGKHILVGTGVIVLAVLILVNLDGTLAEWSLRIWGIGALVWAVWLGLRFLDWNFTHFVVTSDRVIYRTGVLSKHGVEIPLERINNINFHQGLWERVIGAGDLEIESAGRSGQSLFEDVWHPDAVQQEVYRRMEANARRHASWVGGAAAAAGAADDVPAQIAKLADLRDRGAISDTEFEAKKAELLGRM